MCGPPTLEFNDMPHEKHTAEPELIHSRFEAMSAKYPDRTAVIYLGTRYSYDCLRRLSQRFAGALTRMGVQKGDRVMIYISNSIQWVIAFLGIQKIGAVIVPISPIYTSHEIEYIFGYVKEVFEKTSLKRVIVTNLAELLPWWKRLLGFMFDKVPSGRVVRSPRVYPFKSLLKASPVTTDAPTDPQTDLAYILYTGGTTGFPKGVPGNHSGMTSYVNDVTEDVAGEHLKEGGDCYIAVNPLFHIMALGFFMAVGLNKGNTTVLMPTSQVDTILESIGRYHVRWMLGVPTLYRMILENDRVDRYNLTSLKYCYSGGDVLPEEVKLRWKARCQVPIYQVYGSTEIGHVAYSRIGEEPRPRSIGHVLKSRQVRVMNEKTGQPVQVGESGELWVTADTALKEYYHKPDETEKTYVEYEGQVYCRMGDFVIEQENGELVYMERSADIIKHKAYRISASEVEAVLQDHPTVIGSCVIGIPDKWVGERIKAIVVLKEDAKGVGGAELIKWCRERLASYKVPSYVEFRDMLPKSKVGKLLRREVRDDEKRRLAKND